MYGYSNADVDIDIDDADMDGRLRPLLFSAHRAAHAARSARNGRPEPRLGWL